MSRFFDGSGSDSESSGSSEHSDAPIQHEGGGQRFEFESSSSEDEKRVVLSAKDKRYMALKDEIKVLKTNLKSKNWVGIAKGFANLQKLLKKAKAIVAREGTPRFFMKAMVDINTLLQATVKSQSDRKTAQSMDALNSRSLNGMKQKMRKYYRSNKPLIEAYLKNPLVSEEEKSDSEQSDSEQSEEEKSEAEKSEDSASDSDTPPQKTTTKTQRPKHNSDSEFDNDSEDWDSDSIGDDSSDSDDDFDLENVPAGGIQYTRAYWMKKPKDIAKEKQRKEARAKRDKSRKQKKKRQEKKKVETKKEKVYTPEMILKKLKDLLSMRGKRTANRATMIKDLELLSTKATEAGALLKVKVALASAYFEMNLNKGKHMEIEIWNKCYNVMLQMLDALRSNPNVRLTEAQDIEENLDLDGESDMLKNIGKMIVGVKEQKKVKEQDEKDENGIIWIKGNIYSFLYQMSSEYTASMKDIEYQKPEYLIRLREEKRVVRLCELSEDYYRSLGRPKYQMQCLLLKLENMYYHYHINYDRQAAEVKQAVDLKDPNTSETVKACKQLYKLGDTRQRTRALLAHIFFLSLHNWFQRARDLLLMSHIQETINDADVGTRIMFNRCVAQLGLCAFRMGDYPCAMSCLADLHQSQRIKELLAQGVSSTRFHERDQEQEKIEKRRQYPFHKHLNLDMLESVHLLGAMFVEVESIALRKRKVVNKIFRRQYDIYGKNFFNAPPENTRDHIMYACKNLQQGDWRVALSSALSLRMWSFFRNRERVQQLFTAKMKETALRMCLLTFGSSYASVSMNSLTAQFELSEQHIRRVTCRMMLSGLLKAAWDQPSNTLNMQTRQASRLSKVALKFADKAIVFVEQNERLLDQRHGYFKQNDSKRRDNWNRKSKSSSMNYRR